MANFVYLSADDRLKGNDNYLQMIVFSFSLTFRDHVINCSISCDQLQWPAIKESPMKLQDTTQHFLDCAKQCLIRLRFPPINENLKKLVWDFIYYTVTI